MPEPVLDSLSLLVDNAFHLTFFWIPMTKLGFWLKEMRAPFLSLSVALIFLGTSAAAVEGTLDLGRAALALVGLLLLHISVNLINECSDFRSGIDFRTSPTPFSGGSGMLTAGKIAPAASYSLGIVCMAMGTVIGAFFVWVTNIQLLPLLLVGAGATFFYTDFLAKHALGEIFAGLGLGLLPVLGASFVQTGSYSITALAVGIPAGILTFNLLLINEFPDLEADRHGGRKNLLIVFGASGGGKIYTLLMTAMYVWIGVLVLVGVLPVYCMLALLTIGVAWKPMTWAWSGGLAIEGTVPALAANVVTNLATQTLLGAGLLASVYFQPLS